MTEITASKHNRGLPFSVDLKTLGPALALLLLCLVGFMLNTAFLSEGNISNLLTPLCLHRHYRSGCDLRDNRWWA